MAHPYPLPWWKWPATRTNGIVPWYRILWNLIWIWPILVTIYLLVFMAFCKDGWEASQRLRQRIF